MADFDFLDDFDTSGDWGFSSRGEQRLQKHKVKKHKKLLNRQQTV